MIGWDKTQPRVFRTSSGLWAQYGTARPMTTSTAEVPDAGAAQADAEAYRFGRPPESLPSYLPAPASRRESSSAIEIETIDLANRKDRKIFLDLADPIYAGDKNYISALRMHFNKFLNPKDNPSYSHLTVRAFIARKEGKAVGRITAQVDQHYIDYHGSKTGFFGFFECIHDEPTAHALLDAAISWLHAQGIEEIFGPMNFTTNHQCGLLVDNFDRPPYVENTYNPPFYEALLTSYGFGKAKDLLIWMVDTADGMDTPKRKRIQKVADRIRKREGITVRPVSFKDQKAEIARMYDLYMRSWERNWGFVPLAKEEFDFLMADLKMVAREELVLFVEVDGKPVGFSATLPNVNEKMPKNGKLFPLNWMKMLTLKNTTSGRLITLGMLPEYRKRGLEAIMFSETLIAARKLGWKSGEVGWTLEDNDLINRAIESMEGWIDRRYRILGMKINSEPA